MNASHFLALLPAPISAIEAFCRKWRIEQLALFGSILRADFRPESDVDVLVAFAPEIRPGLTDWLSLTRTLREARHTKCSALGSKSEQELADLSANS